MTDTFRQDVRNGLRALFRSRGFALAAVVMLALGIGANTAIFSVLRASSLRGSPLPDPDRLAVIWTTPAGDPQSTEGARIVEYFAWRDRNRTFDAVGTMRAAWSMVEGRVDSARYSEIDDFLEIQHYESRWWRDACLQYFASVSGRTIPSGYAPPARDLAYYRDLAGTCPSNVTKPRCSQIYTGNPSPAVLP